MHIRVKARKERDPKLSVIALFRHDLIFTLSIKFISIVSLLSLIFWSLDQPRFLHLKYLSFCLKTYLELAKIILHWPKNMLVSYEKSFLSIRFSWYLGNITDPWASHFKIVSYWLQEKNGVFFVFFVCKIFFLTVKNLFNQPLFWNR